MTPSGPDGSRRLGRGLEALFGAASHATTGAAARDAESPAVGEPHRIPVARIRPNPFQPRKEFSSDELGELAASLKANGLLQPVTVRPVPPPSGRGAAAARHEASYELIAGERRLRAATQLGWVDIPAIVRELDDRAALTLALVENLQRADLNAIEEAEGYARLAADYDATQQEIADVVGKDRSTVANMLRLLQLPAPIRTLLRDGRLTAGHARALLAIKSEREQIATATQIASQQLTVRDVEAITSKKKTPSSKHKKLTKASAWHNSTTRSIADRLRRHLQTDVQIALTGRERGRIDILFYSNDDLERVLERILGASVAHETL
jgi:ParB family transcriptional regulator, chromosome partitioning protein